MATATGSADASGRAASGAGGAGAGSVADSKGAGEGSKLAAARAALSEEELSEFREIFNLVDKAGGGWGCWAAESGVFSDSGLGWLVI